MPLNFFWTNNQTSVVDDEIDAVIAKMREVGPLDEKYPKLVEYLKALNEMKTKNRRQPVSSDTIAMICGSLFSTVLLMFWEDRHIITNSKSWAERMPIRIGKQGNLP